MIIASSPEEGWSLVIRFLIKDQLSPSPSPSHPPSSETLQCIDVRKQIREIKQTASDEPM